MKFFLTVFLLLAVAGGAFGQTKITALHYDVSIPDKDLKNYISETSWRGVGFDGRWFVKYPSTFTLGIAAAWHVFDEKTSGTITWPDGALTGHQNRYVNSFPLMVTAHYYFGDRNQLWAFIGGGVGTYYILQRFEVGVMAFEEGNWHFGAYPEIGVQIPLQEAALFVSGRYNYAFKTGESLSGEALDYNYWTIAIGLAYSSW